MTKKTYNTVGNDYGWGINSLVGLEKGNVDGDLSVIRLKEFINKQKFEYHEMALLIF